MIVFDLICTNGHTFEGWFEDGKAYDRQKSEGLISCPFCNDAAVEKKLSPFAIKSSSAGIPASLSHSEMMEFSRKIGEFVDRHFDDVGCDFTREALKIHYGVSEPRNIKGVSTEAEEKLLRDEGVEFVKIPVSKTPDPGPENKNG